MKVVAAQKIRDRIFACFDITFPIPVFYGGLSLAGEGDEVGRAVKALLWHASFGEGQIPILEFAAHIRYITLSQNNNSKSIVKPRKREDTIRTKTISEQVKMPVRHFARSDYFRFCSYRIFPFSSVSQIYYDNEISFVAKNKH